MFLKHPIDRMPARMFLYGALLGNLVSGIMFGAHVLYHTGDLTKIIRDFTFALPIGLFFGSIAGIVCGMLIYFLTRYFVSKPYSVVKFRFYAGLTTALIYSVIFLPEIFGALLIAYFGKLIYLFGMFCSVGIAVYCSQVTITKYFRETDVRKQKVK